MSELRKALTIADNLRRARQRIELASHWTKGAIARRADGIETGSSDKNAFSFSIEGAILRFSNSTSTYNAMMGYFSAAIFFDDVIAWNNDDRRLHHQVLLAFNRAIELAEMHEP